MNIVRQQKNETLPINMPLNNSYSFKKGSSLIQLQISSQPVVLINKTLKLNGKLRLNKGTSTNFNTPAMPNNNTNISGQAEYKLRLNERVGINSLFDTITISSMSGQTLESVRNVGRLLAITKPLRHNQAEFDGKLQSDNPAIASRSKISANEVNTEVSFSMPIETGMFEGNEYLPLGRNGVDGLQILIQLSSDSNALISEETTPDNNAFYELIDVSLTYDTLIFDEKTTEEMNRAKTGQLQYNSYSHIYSVINASDTQQNFNFGTSKTLSVFSNTIPTTHLNNISKDSFSTNNFKNVDTTTNEYADADATLERITFIKDAVKVPLDYELDCKDQSTENRPRVEVIDNLKNALDVRGSSKTLVSVNTENKLKTRVDLDGNELYKLDPSISVEPQDNPCFALGISQDTLTKVGRDYKNSTYGLRIESSLDGASPNSLNTFVLSKNTLTYTPNGISVSS